MARSSMLSSALPVSDTDVVTSLALGHSHSSMFKGVTVSYRGATKVAFWTKRMENAIPDSMGLQTAVNHTDREEYFRLANGKEAEMASLADGC